MTERRLLSYRRAIRGHEKKSMPRAEHSSTNEYRNHILLLYANTTRTSGDTMIYSSCCMPTLHERGYIPRFIKDRPLSYSVSAVYIYIEQKKHLWARYGLPPMTSPGVDQTPNQRLVFPSYSPPPWSCVLLLKWFTPLPTLWSSVLSSFSPLDLPFYTHV